MHFFFFSLTVGVVVSAVRDSFSLAISAPAGSEGRRRSREEEEEEALKRKQLQEEQLSKVGETLPVIMSLKFINDAWECGVSALQVDVNTLE